MKAVILAGGIGSRLRPFTEIIPKPLLPIGEKSVLEIQITALRKYGFDEIYFATNYKADYIERFFGDGSNLNVKLTYSKEIEALGTAGPLSLLKDQLTEPFIVMNGDILSSIDFEKFYDFSISKNTHLTIGIKKHITPFAFGDIYFDGDFVTDIEEKPNIEKYILSGIYVMKPSIFQFIPDGKYFGMDKLIKNMLESKIPVTKYEIHEYWLDIGQIADYEKAQEIYNKHFKS